jgi:hypothetical protein
MGTFSNLVRKSDLYGNVHFISLYATILSRLAYNNDNSFLKLYCAIFGPIVTPQIMSDIDKASTPYLIKDGDIFTLNSNMNATNELSKHEFSFKEEHFIAFNELNIPKNVNIITNEIKGVVQPVIAGVPPYPIWLNMFQ